MSIAIVDITKMHYHYGKLVVPVVGKSGGGGGDAYPTRDEMNETIERKITETINDAFGTSAEGVERLLSEIRDNNSNTGILQLIVESNSSSPSEDDNEYPEVYVI